MIGQVVLFTLYLLVAVAISFSVGGGYVTWRIRRGAQVSVGFFLGGLALVAATAPYIGLFGTVWHIIQSLSGIGSGNLNVAAIAKPIGDALYTTLWGLGAAIPSLAAHRLILMALPEEFAE